jgi:predicted O-methyltransferase YrrM
LDAERDAYVDYWNNLQHIIAPKGGILIVDNVISHAAEVQEFIALVQSDARFITTTLSVGAGLFLVCYR